MYASSPCIFEGFQVISCKERRPFSCLHRFLSTRKSGLGAIQNPEINRNLDWRPWCASQEHHFLEAPENRAVAKFLYVFHLCAFSTTATDFSFESKSLPPFPFCVFFLREVGFFPSCRVKVSEVLGGYVSSSCIFEGFLSSHVFEREVSSFSFLKLFLEDPEIRATTRRGLEGLCSNCLYFFVAKSLS